MAINGGIPMRVKSVTWKGTAMATAYAFELAENISSIPIMVLDDQYPRDFVDAAIMPSVTILMLEAGVKSLAEAGGSSYRDGDLIITYSDAATPAVATATITFTNAHLGSTSDTVPGYGELPTRRVSFFARSAPAHSQSAGT